MRLLTSPLVCNCHNSVIFGGLSATTLSHPLLVSRDENVREEAAKAASGLSGTAEGREILMESKLDPIAKLVPMMDDPKKSTSTLALAAIVNRETSHSSHIEEKVRRHPPSRDPTLFPHVCLNVTPLCIPATNESSVYSFPSQRDPRLISV